MGGETRREAERHRETRYIASIQDDEGICFLLEIRHDEIFLKMTQIKAMACTVRESYPAPSLDRLKNGQV